MLGMREERIRHVGRRRSAHCQIRGEAVEDVGFKGWPSQVPSARLSQDDNQNIGLVKFAPEALLRLFVKSAVI